MTQKRLMHRTGYLFLAPYAASFLVFVVLPIAVSLVLSFMRFDLTAQSSAGFVGGDNYRDAVADPYFWSAVRATLLFAVMIVPGLIVVGFSMALGINAMSRGQATVRALVFLPGMLNVAITGILWQWFFNGQFGLFNFLLKKLGGAGQPWLSDKAFAMPSIVLMSVWWTVGGTAIILLTALQQIPGQYFEAAALDGADTPKLFRHITVPLMRPVLSFVMVTTSIAGFQMFGQAFMLTRGGPELSTRGVSQYIYETAFNSYRMGYGAAMSWLLFGLIFVFGAFQYRMMRRRA
ncbi:MAG: carbohydrate ABC transporter permease [Fimbriimonas sp.]